MKKTMTPKIFALLCFFGFSFQAFSQLTVTPGASAQQLVQNLVGTGITVSNITLTAGPDATGTFNGTSSNIGLPMGILLTTGNIAYAPGPNITDSGGDDNLLPGDSTLDILAAQQTFDATILEFDFVPISDTITFRYVFGSEEYPEFVGQGFNDVFGFFLSGPGINGPYPGNAINIALVPSTTIPVAIDNVNDGYSGFCTTMLPGPCTNCVYYVNNCSGTTVEYDGFTTALTARAIIQKCNTYHIRLAIADAGDGIYDSGVFLEEGSFNSGTPVVAAASIAGASTGCAPLPVNFVNQSTGADIYIWNFGDGSPADTSTNPSHTFISTGTFTITLIATDTSACNDADTVTLTVTVGNANVNAGGDSTICAGGSVQLNASGGSTYLWFPATGLSNPNIANPIASPTTTTTYYVVVSSGSCSDTDSVVITVVPLVTADAGTDVGICIGGGIQLNASGGNSYLWYPAAGLSNPNISNPVATPATTTTYYVIVTAGSCSDTDSVVISVLPPPVPNAGPDVTICAGESIQLNASGGSTYTWSPATGLSSANIANPFVTLSVTTTYIVTVANGQCTATDTVTVNVMPAPVVDLGPDITIEKGTQVTLTANTSANNFTWNPSTNLSCSNCQTVTVTPDSTITYQVIVTDNNGCANSDFITIFVVGRFAIYVPNVFTPNGDLHNNIFYVYGENIMDFTLSIYNRWGEKIFESKDMAQGWDGTYKGVPLPMGTYIYLVEFTGEAGGPEMRAGKVSLIR
jgi:gliding motility-associated-like protein